MQVDHSKCFAFFFLQWSSSSSVVIMAIEKWTTFGIVMENAS